MIEFGYCCLVFALVVYITNFKNINKEIVRRWKVALKEARQTYYEINYPYGYYFPNRHKRDVDFNYRNLVAQHCYLDTLYNRKMLKR